MADGKSIDFRAVGVKYWAEKPFKPIASNPHVAQFILEVLTNTPYSREKHPCREYSTTEWLSLQEYLTIQNVIAMVGCKLNSNSLYTILRAVLSVNMPDRFAAAMHLYRFFSRYVPRQSNSALFRGLLFQYENEPRSCISFKTYVEDTSVEKGRIIGHKFWRDYLDYVRGHAGFVTVKDVLFNAIHCAAQAKGCALPFSLHDVVALLRIVSVEELTNMVLTDDFLPTLFDTLAAYFRQENALDPMDIAALIESIINIIKGVLGVIPSATYNRESIAILVDKMPTIVNLFIANHIPIEGSNIWQIMMLQDWSSAEIQKTVRSLLNSCISPLKKDDTGVNALQLIRYRQIKTPAEWTRLQNSPHKQSEIVEQLENEFLSLAARYVLSEIYTAVFVQIGKNQCEDCPFVLIAGEEYANTIADLV
ncbi:MAG: hypothetical protein M0R33_15340 [Methylomonas sp.]|jgi:hypothetical protein|nr:hypothetical protein [Methylomonas sp.]